MSGRLTVALLATVLLAAGCGDSSQRKAVGRYIAAADAIEVKLARPLLTVTKANRDFATGHAKAGDVQRLATAGAQIRRLRRRLAALRPPSAARRLHALLLELVDREASLTDEVRRMTAFFPRFSAALAPVAPATKALKHALAGKRTAAAKAAAFERYGETLAGVIAKLRPLRPPAESTPVYRSELQAIENVHAAVDGLALALRQKRSADIPRLLHDFDVAAVGNQTLAAQKAQIEAVRTYNSRVRSLTTLSSRISDERYRLERTS